MGRLSTPLAPALDQVLHQLVIGGTRDTIARTLHLSIRTVDARLAEIRGLLGTSQRFCLGVQAVRAGWVDPDRPVAAARARRSGSDWLPPAGRRHATAVTLTSCSPNASNPPQGTPRMTHTDDSALNMQRCLGEKGWDVELTDNGGYTIVLDTDQEDQYYADRDECLARFGYDQPPAPLTQQEAEELYARFLVAADCVRGLGYEVPEPSSQQAFVEHMMETPIPPWHPHQAIFAAHDQEGMQLVERECPVD